MSPSPCSPCLQREPVGDAGRSNYDNKAGLLQHLRKRKLPDQCDGVASNTASCHHDNDPVTRVDAVPPSEGILAPGENHEPVTYAAVGVAPTRALAEPVKSPAHVIEDKQVIAEPDVDLASFDEPGPDTRRPPVRVPAQPGATTCMTYRRCPIYFRRTIPVPV